MDYFDNRYLAFLEWKVGDFKSFYKPKLLISIFTLNHTILRLPFPHFSISF